MSSRPIGFTLVELLVVITVLVLLLALLVPAMERAVYQAELTICAGRLDSIAGGVMAYAAGHKRQYPRHRAADAGQAPPNQITWALSPANSAALDMRARLKPFLSLNDHLNCPLTATIDIEGSGSNTAVLLPYALWFGFQYRITGQNSRGLKKLGDRLTYLDHEFSALAGDEDVFWDTNSPPDTPHGSHPDEAGVRINLRLQDQVPPWTVPLVTLTRWESPTAATVRGGVDLNYAFQDGSVHRYDRVNATADPRLVSVPAFNTDDDPVRKRRLPVH